MFYSRGIHLWNLIRCEFTFCTTLCSQALLLMKIEFGYIHWLGEEDSLHCQGALFSASSPTEFSANSTGFTEFS